MRACLALLTRDPQVVLNHLSNDKRQKLLGKLRIEIRLFRELTQPRNLSLLTVGIGCGQPVLGFQLTDTLRAAKPLSEDVHECRIKIVDRTAQLTQLLERGSLRRC